MRTPAEPIAEPNRAIYADLREFLCRSKNPAPVG